MRITEQAKQDNRAAVLKSAAELFAEKGFESTTTRDIAQRAGLAAGTMFNYFPSKETMAMSMVNEALLSAIDDYRALRSGEEELGEELFLFISCGLRRLQPMHAFIGPVLEKSLSPFQKKTTCTEGSSAREAHLATVGAIITGHGHLPPPDFLAVHIYWSLYLGILAFWSRDESPHQDASKAVIDYSLTLFVNLLAPIDPGAAEVSP
jgi:AcrR family transcriptional regulator